MKSSSWKLSPSLVLALVLALVPPAARGADASRTAPGPDPLVVLANDTPSTLRVPAPAGVTDDPVKFNRVIINFLAVGASNSWGDVCIGWSDDAKRAFTHAANIWASLLKSDVPMKISACWGVIPKPGVLGRSGSLSRHRDFAHAPMTGTWYSAALANALAGADLNDADGVDSDGDGQDADAEFQLTLSSTYPWYRGLDGQCPAANYDLVTVGLHEICHGLNFAGTMRTNTAQRVRWGYDGYPGIYDRFTENLAGQSLIATNLFTNNSTRLHAQLTGTNLYFNGPHAKAANGGIRPRIFAPTNWNSGSTYSHFNSDTYAGTTNALMIHFINRGSSIHDPGAMTMGLLADLGWPALTLPPVNRYILNDFDGDRVSDLALVWPERAAWFVYSLAGNSVPAFWVTCGPMASNAVPVPGDYDGDRYADLATYRQGLWFATTAEAAPIFSNMWWGWGGPVPVWGDYDGDQRSDLALYDLPGRQHWFIVSTLSGLITFDYNWGAPGMIPVPGDYDGDGRFDLAIYNPVNGYWYIKTLDGRVLLWDLCWGSPTQAPVPGDFNGDGLYDLAVYEPASGWWYIVLMTLNGVDRDSAQFYEFGGPDLVPVSGDFNGDRISDLALFDRGVTGMWYIQTTAGEILAWTLAWGWQGATVCGQAY